MRKIPVTAYLTFNQREKAVLLARGRQVPVSALLADLVDQQFISVFGETATVADVRGLVENPTYIRRSDGAKIRLR